jgi:hypothetical protein
MLPILRPTQFSTYAAALAGLQTLFILISVAPHYVMSRTHDRPDALVCFALAMGAAMLAAAAAYGISSAMLPRCDARV